MSGVFVRILALIRLKKLGASIFHTIVFNMRMLPFKEALLLPFILFGRVSYSECIPYSKGGGIRRIGESKLKFNSWQIGRLTYHLSNSNQITRLAIKGILILGERGKIYNGANIGIQQGAELKIGTDTVVGSYSRIICYKYISIGGRVNISWECQIFDTNFHYCVDPAGDIKRKDGQVVIGDNVWIGNRVSIMKNSVIPDSCIIASNSLVNKNFSNETYGIIAGIPAVLIKRGYRGEFQKHRKIQAYFLEHSIHDCVNLKEIE